MMQIRVLMAVWLWLGASAADAAPQRPVTFHLENGLELAVLPDASTPAVTHMVWYKTGAAQDPPERPGLSHFLEHMMFRGSQNVGPGQFSRLISAEGGQENAFTTRDMTVFHQQVAADRLELVMRLEAERMTHLTFDPAEVERERQVIVEERRSRVENRPSALLKERMREALLRAHPTLGGERDIRAITAQDLRRFYRARYRPDKALVIVAGNVTPEKAKALAERYYGPIARSPAEAEPEPPAAASAAAPASETVSLTVPQLKQALWMRDCQAPTQATEGREHAYPLLVLAKALGGSEVSRLARVLVYEKKIASDVTASYNDLSRHPTAFSLMVAPLENAVSEALPKLVEDELVRIARDGVTPEELSLAKASLTAEAVYQRDGIQAVATLYGTARVTGAPEDYADTLIERLSAVTHDDIKAAADMLLTQPCVTGHLLPAPEATP